MSNTDDPRVELAKLELEAEKKRLQVAEETRKLTEIKYSKLFGDEALLAWTISFVLLCITTISCYGCYRTTELDYVLHSHGLKFVDSDGPGGKPSQIVPLEEGQ